MTFKWQDLQCPDSYVTNVTICLFNFSMCNDVWICRYNVAMYDIIMSGYDKDVRIEYVLIYDCNCQT